MTKNKRPHLWGLYLFAFLFLAPLSWAAKSNDDSYDAWDKTFEEAEAFYQEGMDYSDNSDWLRAEESFDLSLNSLAELSLKDADLIRKKKNYINKVIDALTDISAQSLAMRISEGMTPDNPDWYSESEVPTDSNTQYLLHHLVDGIDLSRFEMPVEVNERVIREIYRFAYGNSRTFTQASLKRMLRYQTYITERLHQEGLPKELLYLAFIESGFSPGAQSPAKASGVWQFIPGTGKMYGLDINWWVDERRDPYKATNGAIRYLRKLYRDFGDWYLAMAAYNCGEGCIRKAIRNAGDSSYWNLPIPKETQAYVPRVLAVSIIANNLEKYGFKNYGPPLPFPDTLTVPGCVPLSKVGNALGVSTDTMTLLNPELRQKMTPPNTNYLLKLPIGTRSSMNRLLAERSSEFTSCNQKHRVSEGESLVDIARKYKISIAQILEANGVNSTFRVKKGQLLQIPIVNPSDSSKTAPDYNLDPSDPALQSAEIPPVPEFHIVQKGQSLDDIAAMYNLNADDLKRWNSLRANQLAKGKKLNLKAPLDLPETLATPVNLPDPADARPADARPVKPRKTKVEAPKVETFKTETKTEPKTEKPKDLSQSAPQTEKGFRKTALKEKIRQEYLLRPNENLEDVARKTGTTPEDLLAWNRLKPRSKLRAGQSIVWYQEKNLVVLEPTRKSKDKMEMPKTKSLLPSNDPKLKAPKIRPSQESELPKSRSNKSNPTRYKTRAGDSINSVAKQFGISTSDLKKWNGLRGNTLAPGSTLIISKD